MYSKSQILSTSGLYTRIGLREPTKTGYTSILDTEAKTNKSGFYYDRYHTFANFINIYDCQADPDISNAAVNVLVAEMRKSAIMHGLNLVFYDQPDLIQTEDQYRYENALDTLIPNTGKFVGFEISVPAKDNVMSVLNNVVMQFNGVATFELYLFHSSKKERIAVFEATTVADDFYSLSLSQQIYSKSSTYSHGKFYFGYYQDDLGSVQAYDRQYNYSSVQTKYNCVGIKPIKAIPNGRNLFDITALDYTSESYGLNLNISSYYDYSNLIMKNQELFDDIQGYSFAIKALELIKTSGRVNSTKRVNRNLPDVALFDLEDQSGDVPKSTGLNTKLSIAVKRVRKSLFHTDKTLSYIPR